MLKAGEYHFIITMDFKISPLSEQSVKIGMNGTTETKGDETRGEVFDRLVEVCKEVFTQTLPNTPVPEGFSIAFFALEPN